jgi:hypothetical protein
MHEQFYSEDLKRRGHLGDAGVDGRVILKLAVDEWGVIV